MSDEMSKQADSFVARWQNLISEKDSVIDLLEQQVLGLQEKDSSDKNDPVRKVYALVQKDQEDINKLQEALADTSRCFERRFDAVSMMDIEPRNEDMLKKNYYSSAISMQQNSFVLFRIIGNDLYPRHKKGQSRENVRFILENEQPLDKCEKRWVVNRIADPEEEKAIISLLEEFEQQWVHIPFVGEEYKRISFDFNCLPYPEYLTSNEFQNLGPEQKQRLITAVYRLKNNYAMNNNGARNQALKEGRNIAKWVLPWDGNCFLTPRAWQRITEDIVARPWLQYFSVPMTRVLNNDSLVQDDFQPEAVEEPQLVFRKDSIETFNEDFCYGRRPKVELFWRLNIPGKWDRWKDDPWDQKRRDVSSDESQFGLAGWVARLYSGMGNLEQDNQNSFKQRGLARQEAIVSTLQNLDQVHFSQIGERYGFNVLDEKSLQLERYRYKNGEVPDLQHLVDNLLLEAEAALQRGPFSVIDKTTLPPGGDIQDYWHPAPYWWPNPETSDGLPYIRRDGERVPGTILYEEESEKYDRTRVQRLFDDGLTLALAWYFTEDARYASHAIESLRRFFITPETRMNSHLNYAQVRMGHKKNQGMSTGIIEFKDFYFYLDAVRILMTSPVLTHGDKQSFDTWLEDYLDWLLQSPQGIKERQAGNNHGTYYDLQVAAIASFLNRQDVIYETLLRAQSRIACQIAPDGSQPEELTRATTQHYCCYNLQGWINLAEIGQKWGVNLWEYVSSDGCSLKKAAQWLLELSKNAWPFEQIEAFDEQRFVPIAEAFSKETSYFPTDKKVSNGFLSSKAVFFPHDGIRPFWNLGLSKKQLHRPNLENFSSFPHQDGKPYEKDAADKDEILSFNHIVFVRFGIGIFDEDWLDHRLGLLLSVALPSLKKQKGVTFKLVVQIDRLLPERYVNEIRERVEEIGKSELVFLDLHQDRGVSAKSVINENLDAKHYFTIATRIDDDDALTENAFFNIQEEAKSMFYDNKKVGVIIVKEGYYWAPSLGKAVKKEHKSLGIGLSFYMKNGAYENVYQHHLKVVEKFEEKREGVRYLEREQAEWLYTIHKLADTSVNKKIEGVEKDKSAIDMTESLYQKFGIDTKGLNEWLPKENKYRLVSGEKTTEQLKSIENEISVLRSKSDNSSELEKLFQRRRCLTQKITRCCDS